MGALDYFTGGTFSKMEILLSGEVLFIRFVAYGDNLEHLFHHLPLFQPKGEGTFTALDLSVDNKELPRLFQRHFTSEFAGEGGRVYVVLFHFQLISQS